VNLVQEIKSNFNSFFREGSRFILGVSGGKDSMLLANLMLEAHISFHIAHVNYQLRGEESDKDQAFIEAWGQQHNVIVHCIKVQYTENEKNIQAWARSKRRDYFEVLLHQEKATAIVLAHHVNDLWETHWLKLLRFQVEGNSGMLPWIPPYFRPLLYTPKTIIDKEVKARNMAFREDKSNQSIKYNRNFLRHQIIPEINQRFGISDEAIVEFNQRKSDKEAWNYNLMHTFLNEVVTNNNDIQTFDCKKTPSFLPLSTPLFHWLTPLGFSPDQITAISNWEGMENGKKIESPSHILWKENNTFKVSLLNEEVPETYEIHSPFFLDLCAWQGKKVKLPNPAWYGNKTHLQLDLSKIEFPCTIRPWRNGEKFQPFGMSGHVLVSDYLNQKGIAAALKSKIVVLESNNKIAAILGIEVANWCRIEQHTQGVWLIHPFPGLSTE
jgi:tRNA(Ile)-lysidine synthase